MSLAVALGALLGPATPLPDVPPQPSAAVVGAPASGEFQAQVDFGSLQLRSVGQDQCELTVRGALVFSGTLQGRASGRTTALVVAPCEEVATTPPGTFGDLFRFEGRFVGSAAGVGTSGRLTYAGLTRPGGDIDAIITLEGRSSAALLADARVAVGGTYIGIASST